MASLFKPTVSTYALANGKHRTPDGERVTKAAPGSIKITRASKIWYGRFKDAGGTLRRVPLTANKEASKQMLAAMVTESAKGKMGIGDLYAAQNKKPLVNHLEDFAKHLRTTPNKHGRKNTSRHVVLTVNRIESIVGACGFIFLRDIDRVKVQDFLAVLHDEKNLSKQSCNHYRRCAKQFCTWALEEDRLAKNPLLKLKMEATGDDPRHKRRAFLKAELPWIFTVTAKSDAVYWGLNGQDRVTLYSLALATGFRAKELASLTPADFDFDLATVNLDGKYTKNRKPIIDRPIPRELAQALRSYLAGRSKTAVIFPGWWQRKAGKMVKRDLASARQEWLDESPTNDERTERDKSDFLRYKNSLGWFADMHAWRHSFVSMLVSSGVNSKVAMDLARHSSQELLDRYSHTERQEIVDAVGKLNSFLPTQPTENNESRLDRALTKPVIKHDIPLVAGDEVPAKKDTPSDSFPVAENATNDARCERLVRDGRVGVDKHFDSPQAVKLTVAETPQPLLPHGISENNESRLDRALTSDPKFALVVSAWPALSTKKRKAILALITKPKPTPPKPARKPRGKETL